MRPGSPPTATRRTGTSLPVGLVACLALFLFALPTAMAAGACAARSGKTTTALLELYTSEGCSSCPPADRHLASLPNPRHGFAQVVPLALHVPYWDYIGWKDAYASSQFAERQSWLLARNNRRTAYTPHFFVAGAEVLDWQARLDAEVQRIAAAPAAAEIEVSGAMAGADRLALTARASAPAGAALDLFLAITESGIVTAVRAGENQGATLKHDHVVRKLIGPLPFSDGRLATRQELALDPAWKKSRLRLVAFVQSPQTGRVLQAVATERCELAP